MCRTYQVFLPNFCSLLQTDVIKPTILSRYLFEFFLCVTNVTIDFFFSSIYNIFDLNSKRKCFSCERCSAFSSPLAMSLSLYVFWVNSLTKFCPLNLVKIINYFFNQNFEFKFLIMFIPIPMWVKYCWAFYLYPSSYS